MKKLIVISLAVLVLACNNKKSETAPDAGGNPSATNTETSPAEDVTINTGSYTNFSINVEGKEIKLSGSILVDKDPKKLKAGAPYRAMITTSSGPNNEGMILGFVFDTKPGTYPVTGRSFNRGKNDASEQYGGLMGGEQKIYDGEVVLTSCEDLGDNGAGGHRWKIAGTIENLTIPALGLMLLDDTKKHPKEVKIEKISFSDMTFDDNAEEMLKKALDELDKMKKK